MVLIIMIMIMIILKNIIFMIIICQLLHFYTS